MTRRCAPRPAGRAAHVVSRCSTRTLSKLLTFSQREDATLLIKGVWCVMRRWWWEKDDSSLRSSPCGPCCARCLALLDANLVEASHLLPTGRCNFINKGSVVRNAKMVVGEGFEPSKSVTADLQSAPFGRSGIPPRVRTYCLKAGRIIPNESML